MGDLAEGDQGGGGVDDEVQGGVNNHNNGASSSYGVNSHSQNKSGVPNNKISYARTVTGNIKGRDKLNILDIILERKDRSFSYNLTKDELAKLLIKKMKLSPAEIRKIDMTASKRARLCAMSLPENHGIIYYRQQTIITIRRGGSGQWR